MIEFIELLPAQQRIDEVSWYRGTADAVYQNMDIIQSTAPNMWCWRGITSTRWITPPCCSITSTCSRVTVACIEVPRQEASAFGVMAVDESRKINAFVESLADPPRHAGQPDTALASMGSTSSTPTTSISCWKRISPTRSPTTILAWT
ncbi:sugar phosphate nucleotidyltransferase [Aeromonas sp. Marseille-Q7275]